MAEIFGKDTKGVTEDADWNDWVLATKFTSGSAGFLASMTLYLKEDTPGAKIKCVIYDSSFNLLANGTTEEKSVPSAHDDWLTFNFPMPPQVAASTVYYLAFWNDEHTYFYHDPGSSNQMAR